MPCVSTAPTSPSVGTHLSSAAPFTESKVIATEARAAKAMATATAPQVEEAGASSSSTGPGIGAVG